MESYETCFRYFREEADYKCYNLRAFLGEDWRDINLIYGYGYGGFYHDKWIACEWLWIKRVVVIDRLRS